MTIAILAAMLAFAVGYVVASARASRRAPVPLLDTAFRVAITAAQQDGATLARIAYQKAQARAAKERRVLFPPDAWGTLAPDHREAVYRIAAGVVEVIAADAAERVKRAKS